MYFIYKKYQILCLTQKKSNIFFNQKINLENEKTFYYNVWTKINEKNTIISLNI